MPDATVAGDAVALRRVVANLIGNAVKFGRSSVAVAVRRAEGACEVVVEDDGPGIPRKERSAACVQPVLPGRALAEPPHRRDRPRARHRRQIAEAHGGTIVAEPPQPAGPARDDVAGPRVTKGKRTESGDYTTIRMSACP